MFDKKERPARFEHAPHLPERRDGIGDAAERPRAHRAVGGVIRKRNVLGRRLDEFDRETGKLSEDDYASLKAKYTGEALAALRAEGSAGPAPDLEAMISARVRSLTGGSPPPCPTCGPRPESDAAFCSTCGLRLDTGRSCGSCGAALPPDSGFCERCGASVAA